MFTSRSCSWCHNLDPPTVRTCSECGHDAHEARLSCSCPRCALARHKATFGDLAVPLAELVAEALAGLRQKTTHESEPTGENCTTWEFPRAEVSPTLAALIRTIDAAMIDEFGADGFAFAIMVDDGIVAAHNARDGFVMPIVALLIRR